MPKPSCPCTKEVKVSRIVVEENKRKATFVNVSREAFLVTKVDGCLCHNELAADWVVEKKGRGIVVVELKGKDVPHGVAQVEATAQYWVDRRGARKIAGLVVCRQRPSYSSSIQKCQVRFARKYLAPLHVIPANRDYEVEKIMTFDGP